MQPLSRRAVIATLAAPAAATGAVSAGASFSTALALPPPVRAAAKPDPVFAAIAHWRPLQAAADAAMESDDDALVDIHYGPAARALTTIYETEPTTPEGLLAILVVMREQDSVHLDCETLDSCCDDLRRGLFRAFQSAERLLNKRGRS